MSSHSELAEVLQKIGLMDLQALRDEWLNRYGCPVPPLRSPALLRQLIAWRIQAAALGGIDRTLRRALQCKGTGLVEGLGLGEGARLTRYWNGRLEEVIVGKDGFQWKDQKFRSLSAAASAIAGSRWNGPRFFGLRTGEP